MNPNATPDPPGTLLGPKKTNKSKKRSLKKSIKKSIKKRKKSKKTSKKTDKTLKGKKYLIFDNGGRPYKVIIKGNSLDIFTYDDSVEDINYDDYEILVISKMSVWSLSENLYLSVQSTSNGSKILVEISTLFSVYSWGKNEENFKNLFKKFEESFII